MKRFIKIAALILSLLLLCGCVKTSAPLAAEAVLPEDKPYLAMYVEYEKTDEYCTTHARATLLYVNGNGKDDNPAAQDIVIELETEDTLELIEGSDYHVFFDDLPCGGKYTFEFDLFCAFPMEQVEKAPEPKLTISVESANAGGCEYICLFDSMTEPRSIVMGWETGDKAPNAIKNDIGMMNELFGRSYYNKQPVEVHSYYNRRAYCRRLCGGKDSGDLVDCRGRRSCRLSGRLDYAPVYRQSGGYSAF